MKVAIYARVSTSRQRERETIRSQLRLLPEYAKAQGWSVVETYVDDGISGETVDARPAFQRLLGDAERSRFETVLVIDLDRITRSRRSAEGALIYDHFRECKVKIATPGQGLIDLEDEDQDLLAGIKRELAKWEKRKILARTMRGKREAARQGRRYGSLDPYGLRWVREPENPRRGRYDACADEAAIVRRIYGLATAHGMGVALIVGQLNAEGLRTRATKRRPNGGRWAPSTVRKILRSSTYRGAFQVFKAKGEPITIAVEPLVSLETWEAAQHALRERRSEARWKHDRRYLLAGVARCGVCGEHMWVVNARPGRAWKSHAYYRCATTNAWRKMGRDGPCGNRHHRVDRTDAAVWTRLVEVLDDPVLLRDACEAGAAGDAEGVDWNAQRRVTEARRRELTVLEGEVLARRRRGLLSEAACDNELAAIGRERALVARNIRLAESQLADRAARAEQRRSVETKVAELRARIRDASFEERRALVRAIAPRGVGHVTLHSDGRIEIVGVLDVGNASAPIEVATTTRAAS